MSQSNDTIKPGLVPMPQRMASIPVPLLVRLLLNNTKVLNLAAEEVFLLEKIAVSPDFASFLQELDPDEELIHIQWDDVDSKMLQFPFAWNRFCWNQSAEKFQSRKAKSAEDRATNEMRHQLVKELKLAIMADVGFDDEMAAMLAVSIVTQRKAHKAKFFGVDISKLPEVNHEFINIKF